MRFDMPVKSQSPKETTSFALGVSIREVVVLGTGAIGMRHIEVLRRLEAVPVALPVRSQRVAQLRREGYEAFSSLEEAKARGACCAVIATDTGRHAEDAIAALRLGFHLLVEKPLAVDAGHAQSVLEEARATGKSVFVGCVLRFSESLNQFRRWLPEIGKLHSVAIECRSYLPDWRPNRPYRETYSARADEGGVLRDLIHEVDYAGWIFGWPKEVSGQLLNLGRLGIEAEEVAELRWQMPEGYPLSIGLDYLTRPTRRGIRAFGEKGTIEWDGREGTVRLLLSGEEPQIFHSSQTRDEMFIAQARAFLKAAEGDLDPRLATGLDGVKALEVYDAVRRS